MNSKPHTTVHHEPIFTDLSPNSERRDRRLSRRLTLRPWLWKRGEAIVRCEEWFRKHLNVRYAWGVNSGRSGLYLILKALNVAEGDEVLVQAFTCSAVPNPALWMNANVVYVDIDEDSLNMDPVDLEKKITPRSKAIVVQHTFGCPADMDRIMEIAAKHQVIIIEDCAHALGATYHGRTIGTIGTIAFFSFGRDKVISSVYGGMVATDHPKIARRIDEIYASFRFPSLFWIWQQLRHTRLMEIVIRRYFTIGKYILVFAQKTHLLSLAVQKGERQGIRPYFFPRRLPNALAVMALDQLGRLEGFNLHRKRIAQLYRAGLAGYFTHTQQKNTEDAIFLRYTLRSPHRDFILREAKRQRVMLGKWYLSPIAPEDTALDRMQYESGSCPRAERVAREAFNLPTHIRISETGVRRVMQLLKTIDEEIRAGRRSTITTGR